MKRWLVLLLLLLPARVEAQPAPTIVTTLQTTNTGTTSVAVGCAVGSGTCTGGILSGPISASLISLSSGYVEIQSFVPASQTNRLVNNAGTLQWNGSALAIGGSISGTTNTIPLFTGPSSIGNSIMTQSGTTITVANTLSATTLTGLLSTANQSNVTGLGTVTSGTWQATKIGLAFGGTNADLSGTGGTSQFLRQNSLGAAVTVIRPAVADLSDNANVCLLTINCLFGAGGSIQFGSSVALITNGAIYKHASDGLTLTSVAGSTYDFSVLTPNNSVGIILVPTGTSNLLFQGTITNTASVAGSFLHSIQNTNAAANSNTFWSIGNNVDANLGGIAGYSSNTVASGLVGPSYTVFRANGNLVVGTTGATGVFLGTNNAIRWGVDLNGNFIFGASSHIADSNGTPTIGSGGGTGPTIAGQDYAFTVTLGTGTFSTVTVNFGHTFSSAPPCSVADDAAVAVGSRIQILPTTTNIQLTAQTGNFVASSHLWVQCRGF